MTLTGAASDSRPVVVLGAGGHAAVVIDALRQAGRSLLGCLDPVAAPGSTGPLDCAILGGDEWLAHRRADEIELVNGVGATDAAAAEGGSRRAQLHHRWQHRFAFASVLHPAAIVATGCDIDAGAQIMAGAVLQTGARIGPAGIVNTGARIDHDCQLGTLVHVAPGAVLCGDVVVADGAFIGAGATIVPGVRIGSNARVGAGMTVLGDVPPNMRLSPADGICWLPHAGSGRLAPAGAVARIP